MGTNEKTNFSRVNEGMLPEEISAEVLKYLKESVVRKYPDINTN
jgi:molecular chaperone DnaK (HSP70)